jgi:deoxyribose-phosphate aldolase
MYPHIEYNLLDPLVTDNQIDAAAKLAVLLQVGGLCIPPYWVKKASREVAGASVDLLTVVGYPFGYQRTEAKIAEMELAFSDGATAIELVINMSAFKSQRINWIKAEIARFAHLVHAREAMLTVVTDIDKLSKKELEIFCKTSTDSGADYVKTTTRYLTKEISSARLELVLEFLPASVGMKVYTQIHHIQELETLLKMGVEKVCVPDVVFLQKNENKPTLI